MSDTEVEPKDASAEAEEEMDIYSAIREVMKRARNKDGLFKGINECARAIDRQKAKVCFLAKNCENPDYKVLIKALCSEHEVPLVEVDDRAQLGEWAGLCKIDTNGTARNVAKTSSVVVTEVEVDTNAYKVLSNFINSQRS
jgi:small subunit ribosomal protein S12e